MLYTQKKNLEKRLTEAIIHYNLGKNYTSKIIGYTIVVKKWRKPVRE